MYISDRLDKKFLTTVFLKAGDIAPTQDNIKRYYPIWWLNVRTDGGLRLTDKCMLYLTRKIGLEHWEYKLPKDLITQQILLDLDRHIDCPYWLSKPKTTLVLFGEETSTLMTLYNGDIELFLNSTKAWF